MIRRIPTVLFVALTVFAFGASMVFLSYDERWRCAAAFAALMAGLGELIARTE